MIWTILLFIFGLMVGATFGFFAATLMLAAKEIEDGIEWDWDRNELM